MSNTTKLVLIISDVRSAYNVGTMIRTAEACAANEVITTGITPHLFQQADETSGHVANRHAREIAKSALGAEQMLPMRHFESLQVAINNLRDNNYNIIALESKREGSKNLLAYQPPTGRPTALIVGSETAGIPPEICRICDAILEIPMLGQKASLNVAVAAGIGLYHFRKYYPLL